ncbi:Uncharacterised protein [Segatella copri]|nr:Uncharacterised protein [Segatella copri]
MWIVWWLIFVISMWCSSTRTTACGMTAVVTTTNVCAAVMEMSGLRSMNSLLPEADRARLGTD